MDDTHAGLPALSSPSPDGKLAQRSERDVAPRSTAIDFTCLQEIQDPEKAAIVLLALLKGLVDNTFNGDIVVLALYRAQDILEGVIEAEEVHRLGRLLLKAVKRRKTGMDSMFDQKGFTEEP